MPDLPKNGDVFVCGECGMSLVITNDCGCADPACVKLECCGQEMQKEAA